MNDQLDCLLWFWPLLLSFYKNSLRLYCSFIVVLIIKNCALVKQGEGTFLSQLHFFVRESQPVRMLKGVSGGVRFS